MPHMYDISQFPTYVSLIDIIRIKIQRVVKYAFSCVRENYRSPAIILMPERPMSFPNLRDSAIYIDTVSPRGWRNTRLRSPVAVRRYPVGDTHSPWGSVVVGEQYGGLKQKERHVRPRVRSRQISSIQRRGV